jgi:hypothetical protein
MKKSKHESRPDFLKSLHPDEPFFFIRAQDRLSVEAVKAYAQILHRVADTVVFHISQDLSEADAISLALSLSDQATEVAELAMSFIEWQKANPDKVKYPD